jgi:hypothetical protein
MTDPTLHDVLNELRQVNSSTRELHGKVDVLMTMRKEERGDITSLSKRTRRLERKWAFSVGIASIVATIAGWFIPSYLKKAL